MKFRYARHTNNLTALVNFYHDIIGLQKLGGFSEHDGYAGVFLGFPEQDWHLEFTQSADTAKHQPDKDDLIVLYVDNEQQVSDILNRAKEANIYPVTSKNPYWNNKGIELTDPDGFGVILAVTNFG